MKRPLRSQKAAYADVSCIMFLCMYAVCVKKINEIKQKNKQKVQR